MKQSLKSLLFKGKFIDWLSWTRVERCARFQARRKPPMFSYQALHNHAGIAVLSHYPLLKTNDRDPHNANQRSPLIRDKESFFLPSLGFVYHSCRAPGPTSREILQNHLLIST